MFKSKVMHIELHLFLSGRQSMLIFAQCMYKSSNTCLLLCIVRSVRVGIECQKIGIYLYSLLHVIITNV